MTNFDAQIRQADRRAQGYWLLSRLFMEAPTASVLTNLYRILADADVAAVSPEMAALRDAVSAALAEPNAAVIAFAQHLSMGDRNTGEAISIEAHVREGCLPGKSTQQVASVRHATGYDDDVPGTLSPNNLGADLGFMALLCRQELEAWSERDLSEARKALQLQHKFLSLYLSRWAPGYCRELAEQTTNDYLRAVAVLAASSIDDDVAILEEICRWLVPADLSPLVPAQGNSASDGMGEAVHCAPSERH